MHGGAQQASPATRPNSFGMASLSARTASRPPDGLGVEGREPPAAATACGPGVADRKAGCDLLTGGVAFVAGRHDPFAEVHRVGFHPAGLLIIPGITVSTDVINRRPL